MMFLGVDIEERENRAEELLELVDLGNRMDHYPNQLSGGQMQRVAIARSLANDPEVILADEPTGNLDTKTGQSIIEFLEKLNIEGKTIIMVTHESELAKKVDMLPQIKHKVVIVADLSPLFTLLVIIFPKI